MLAAPAPAAADQTDIDDAAPEDAEGAPAAQQLRYSDAQLLAIVREQRRDSVGFGEGDSGLLAQNRIRAQEYRQGKITDLPVLEGRSAAVDTTFGDAVDTAMPDIMEVFFGGDDVVTFDADNPDDEGQARAESDFVAQVMFGQNEAFRAFHDAIKDALENRLGVWSWWWEKETKPIGSVPAENAPQAALIAQLMGQKRPWAKAQMEQREDGSFAINFSELRGRLCFKAFPCEDLTVAADTVEIRKSAYCALRDRPRVQDLIERGIAADVARSLPRYTTKQNEMTHVRDESGEDERAGEDGLYDLRIVEVRTHYLRIDADDDGKVEIWRIETDAEETKLLQKECVTQIPISAFSPFLNAHRLHGESLFDKLFEVQKIKTVLQRMLLDSGYFALNQRYEVSEQAANEFTIADLLNNAPNVPVRSETGAAVRPLTAGQLGFDVLNALEYMSVVGEQRSGIVRNAQGLNPDTLHETASGVTQLIMAAQKRIRFICRVIAETGVKELALGIHQMLREESTDDYAPMQRKVGDSWREVCPGDWPERSQLTVHVGAGSAGKDKDIQVQEMGLQLLEKVIEMQGGANGPFVTPQNIFNRLKAVSRAMGEKNPTLYWSDPGEGPVQPPGGQGAPGAPTPEMMKVQADAQLGQMRLQSEQQLDQAKAQSELQLQFVKMQGDLQAQRQQMAMDMQLEREKAANELSLQRQEMIAEIQLQRERMAYGQRPEDVDDAVDDLPGGPG